MREEVAARNACWVISGERQEGGARRGNREGEREGEEGVRL